MPDCTRDKLDARHVGAKIHQCESVEERISLSERFGLRLSFHPFNQQDCIAIVRHWVTALDRPGCALDPGGAADWDRIRVQALQWALDCGSRGGRSAHQFARVRVGRKGLGESG